MDKRCKCPMAISVTGDGCRYCQPQEYIDRLGEWLDEERKDSEKLAELLSAMVTCVDWSVAESVGVIHEAQQLLARMGK